MRRAGRDAYNEVLARNKAQYQAHKAGKGDKPPTSYFALRDQAKLYSKEAPWLGHVSVTLVYNYMKPLADAFQRFFAGAGYPNFKTMPTIYMFQRVNIRQGNRLYVPMVGRVKLTGPNPYSGCKAKNATLKYEAGDWYITILYEVLETRPAKPSHPAGIDRNVGQVALSTREMYFLPELKNLDAKLRRLQRKLVRQQHQSNGWQRTLIRMQKTYRKIRHGIKNWCHQTSRTIADVHDGAILEALHIQGMARSARGSKDKPGKHVAQKRGLNRAILRSGWGQLERYMSYKTHTRIK